MNKKINKNITTTPKKNKKKTPQPQGDWLAATQQEGERGVLEVHLLPEAC